MKRRSLVNPLAGLLLTALCAIPLSRGHAQCAPTFNTNFQQGVCGVQLSLEQLLANTAGLTASDYRVDVRLGAQVVESAMFGVFTDLITLDGVVGASGPTTYSFSSTGSVQFAFDLIDVSGLTPVAVCSGTFNVFGDDATAPTISAQLPTPAIACSDPVPSIESTFLLSDNCDPLGLLTVAPGAFDFNATEFCAATALGSNYIVTRPFTVTDASGNTATGAQQVEVLPQPALATIPDLVPENITFTCDQYAQDASITDYAPLNPTVEASDTDGDANNGSITVDPALDFGQGGLNTGAGVLGTPGGFCQFNCTLIEDDTIPLCGQSLSAPLTTFKIIRQYTIINDCNTSDVFRPVQVIQVIDPAPPTISVPPTIALTTNVPGVCASTGLIPAPVVTTGGCVAVDPASIVVSVPGFGVATPVTVGGVVVGYQLPAPGIPAGTSATVNFSASTACPNSLATASSTITVTDATPPVAICDEITNLSLTVTPTAAVFADDLDDGSYDNCGPVFFKVLRMDELVAGNGVTGGIAVTCGNANNNGEPSNIAWFDDEAFFCCADIATNNNMVIVRVFDVDPGDGFVAAGRMAPGGDLFGRFNDCMVEVEVEDKLPPVLVQAPAPQALLCTDVGLVNAFLDPTNAALQPPIFFDACDFTVSLVSVTPVPADVLKCGGTITRVFVATDDNGNTSAPVSQTITVATVTDYAIPFPADQTVTSCNGASPGLLNANGIVNDGCGVISLNVEEQDFFFPGGGTACRKILRTYTTLNCCSPNLTGDPVDVEVILGNQPNGVVIRVEGTQVFVGNSLVPNAALTAALASSAGFTYTQVIDINDSQAPVVSVGTPATCEPGDVGGAAGACTQGVSVPFTLTDACTPDAVTPTVSVFDAAGNVVAVTPTLTPGTGAGQFNIELTLPLGAYELLIGGVDGCGNNAVPVRVPITAVDCKPPTTSGITLFSIDLMATGMVPVTLADFNASATDACGAVSSIIKRAGTSSAGASGTVILDCGDFAAASAGTGFVPLVIVSTDAAGNMDSLFVEVDLQDNLGACAPNLTASVSGAARTAAGQGVEGVRVTLAGDYFGNVATDATGAYSFGGLTPGGDLTLAPSHVADPTNGVTTYDVYMLGQHLLGNAPLSSPEQLIAADANASGGVSAFDMTVVRRVVLGLDPTFRNNDSWRFVAGDYAFPEPTNPWSQPWPEVVSHNDLTGDVAGLDVTAIKIGDLNASARTNSRQPLAPREAAAEAAMRATLVEVDGDILTYGFSLPASGLLGYQGTLTWSADEVELIDIVPGKHPISGFGTQSVADGQLAFSHDGEVLDGELFRLQVRVKAAANRTEAPFRLGGEIAPVEAFDADGARALRLHAGDRDDAGFALRQNSPNPFTGLTRIAFTLPESGAATLSVRDAGGREVWRVSGLWPSGESAVELRAGDLRGASGVLSYTLTAGDRAETRRLVIVP